MKKLMLIAVLAALVTSSSGCIVPLWVGHDRDRWHHGGGWDDRDDGRGRWEHHGDRHGDER